MVVVRVQGLCEGCEHDKATDPAFRDGGERSYVLIKRVWAVRRRCPIVRKKRKVKITAESLILAQDER